jgi:L-threonylcarbamoyladenylate synthase
MFSKTFRVAWQIMDLSENPTTLVLDNQETLLQQLPDKTLGIRIIKEPFCFKLLEHEKTTCFSANISGQPTLKF